MATEKLVVVRVRGDVNIRHTIRNTLKMLRLHKPNHAVILDNTPDYMGMLRKAKDYITWGPLDKKTLVSLLEKRGRLEGNKRLTEEYLKEKTKFSSFDELAEQILSDKADISSVPGLKPVFRLHPPRKGYGKIKRPFSMGGVLGDRGPEIVDLIKRMV